MTSPSSCGYPGHHICPECGDEILEGRYTTISLPRLDDKGRRQVTDDGELLTIEVRTRHHILPFHSKLDPTGLAPAICTHGLREHPDAERQNSPTGRLATSWIRSRYLVVEAGAVGKCVVCMGQPRPADLTAGYS